MPQIIYEKNPNSLIPSGDRGVSTFPSGLVKVEQSFICNKNSIAFNRSLLSIGNDFPNGSRPAIDGLKIFPEVQETERQDGFVEFKVSAFGRLNTTGTSFIADKTQIITGPSLSDPAQNVTGVYRSKYKTTKLVIPKGQAYSYDITGVTSPSLINGLSVESMFGSYINVPTSTETIDYGSFVEVTYVIESVKLYGE